MAAVQAQFDKFHDRIKLDEHVENALLREKRDTLLDALRRDLSEHLRGFEVVPLGSNAVRTGVVPLDGNYDIDVGLVFEIESAHIDPVTLKAHVRDVLAKLPQRTVVIRHPCVTVNYMRGDEVAHHVDLSIYAQGLPGPLKLARGKEFSAPEHHQWADTDPKGLISAINDRFSEADERSQMRRCIRYLKRWREVNFSTGRPPSIGLTCAARAWLVPVVDLTSGRACDLDALLALVQRMMDEFRPVYAQDAVVRRLVVELPAAPYKDTLCKLTNAHMQDFEWRLGRLRDALAQARSEPRPEVACAVLAKLFGEDFPVPTVEQTARRVAPAVISTGTSG